MNYGYVRVSTLSQNIDRQIEGMLSKGLSIKQIFIDKESGKDFRRKNYLKLRKKIKEKDLLIIKSIDRLGRNYAMIIEEWYYITKIIKADILVIDMPLLDTRIDDNQLFGRFISDIVLQILSFVAENERDQIKLRQAEGIKQAKLKGIHLGRSRYNLSHDFNDIATLYLERKLTSKTCAQILQMNSSTFRKYASIHKKNSLKNAPQ